MKQEDKELLFKDLSARLPYGVILNCCDSIGEKLIAINENGLINYDYDIEEVKPYLFPLSSITEEQRFELKKQHSKDGKILQEICKEIYTNMNLDKSGLGVTYNAEDWCNANHFDYRGLIEKGLAIPVTKENNPYK